jgi:hypothetical protein
VFDELKSIIMKSITHQQLIASRKKKQSIGYCHDVYSLDFSKNAPILQQKSLTEYTAEYFTMSLCAM